MTDEHEHAMKVAKVIAKAMGDNFSDAFKNKQRWTAKRGMSGGRFRDVNEPFQDDYIAAAQAAAAVIAADRAGLVAEIERLREALSLDAVRFEHCAEMIAKSFEASGTLRAERTIKAEHYALEARAALKDTRHDA
jgi:superfamily I DNA and RNA helicase